MRILLISTPYPHLRDEAKNASPPIGLAYIAAVLEQNGYRVRIVDCVVEGYHTETTYSDGTVAYGLSVGEVLDTIGEYLPDVIGISALFSTLDDIVRDLAEKIRQRFPEIKIVLGGTHATVMAEKLVREPYVDYVIRGEGDYAFLRLVEHLEQRRPIQGVNNLTWMENGAVMSNIQEFIQDVDELPHPARHLLNMEGYFEIGRLQGLTKKGARATTIITSRGCPAKCVFCAIHSVWGHRFRGHSPEYVLREMQVLQERYQIDHLVFQDDNLTFDRRRAAAVFQGMIDRGYGFSWTAPNGVAVWALDDHLLRLAKESGCHWLWLGVESGDPETLTHLIKKPLRLDKVEHIVRTCRELGIHTSAFFVIGLPGETKESIDRSMKYAHNLDVDSLAISIATPYPGTALYTECKERGYLVPDFRLGNLTPRMGQIQTPEFGPKDLEKIVNRTLVRHALKHPVAILRRAYEKFQASPAATLSFVARRFLSGVFGGMCQ